MSLRAEGVGEWVQEGGGEVKGCSWLSNRH